MLALEGVMSKYSSLSILGSRSLSLPSIWVVHAGFPSNGPALVLTCFLAPVRRTLLVHSNNKVVSSFNLV